MTLKEVVITTVIGCARCGDNHENLRFKRFSIPIKDEDGIWSYWALCPNSLDPVLLRITPDNASDFEDD